MNAPLAPIAGRLADLRSVLARHGVAAILIPSSDPHISEYLPERWQARRWASGFTGSMGTLVVTADFAGVWADSRYWVQAEKELAGSGIALVKIYPTDLNAHLAWLAEHVPAGGVVAVDGDVLGLAAARALKSALSNADVKLRTDLDLVGEAWKDRPALPTAPVREFAMPQAVTARAEKLAHVRSEMKRLRTDVHVVSTLDDIAWLLNLRGSDVKYNPVFVAHLVIASDKATLYVEGGKIDADLAKRLAADGVHLAPYADAKAALGKLPASGRILIDPSRVTLGFVESLPKGAKVVEAINPSTLAKSRKSAGEAAFIRETMEQDGAALCELFAGLEASFAKGERVTELDVDTRVNAARARRPGFVSPSFSTIAGWNANGALPHYRATEESHSVIEGEGLLLIDSGGQYLGGTTDITRVIVVGKSTKEQREDYTRVLKGMIQLSLARFPRGVRSTRLDTIARAPIWAGNVDYGHGTGHGVGYFMNVHEGPQTISFQVTSTEHHGMEPGMITSNEPGIYRPGRWGVRIENLVLAAPAGGGEFGDFLAFETLTLCPIDTRPIELAMLDAREREWLNAYHATVRERLSPHVSGAAKEWLERTTQAV